MTLLCGLSYSQGRLSDVESFDKVRNTYLTFGLNFNTTFGFMSQSLPKSEFNQVKFSEFYTKDLTTQILRSNFFLQSFTDSNAQMGLFLKLNTHKGKNRVGLGYLLQANYGNILHHYKDNIFSGKVANAQLGLTYSFRKAEKSGGVGFQLLGGGHYLLSYDLYEKSGEFPTSYKKIESHNETFAKLMPQASLGVFYEFFPGGSKLAPQLLMSHKYRFIVGINYDFYPNTIFKDNSGYFSLNIKTTFAKPFKLK